MKTDTIYDYLTPEEAQACRAYRRAYAAEHGRLAPGGAESAALAGLRRLSDLAWRRRWAASRRGPARASPEGGAV